METRLELKDRQSLYKLIIPKEVELKIRTLLKEIYNTEWSGVMFYTYEGNIIDGLTITCKDLLPLDIGNSTFTSFEENGDIVSYMVEHDLLDCQQGLVHSHHSMKTFFSGTDMGTLEENAIERNNFLSLIVNNDGDYNAAFTWKEIVKESAPKMSFFGKMISPKKAKETEVEKVFYSYMTIDRWVYKNKDDAELINQIQDLKKKKQEKQASEIINQMSSDKQFLIDNLKKIKPLSGTYTPGVYTQGELFPEQQFVKENTKEKAVKEDKCPYENSEDDEYLEALPKEMVEEVTAKLVTLSLVAQTIPTNYKNLEKVINSRLEELEKFYPDCYYDLLSGFVDIVFDNFVYTENMPEGFDYSKLKSITASAVWMNTTSEKFQGLHHMETVNGILEIMSSEEY